MTQILIRQASQVEFAVALDWASMEGWNPGLDDLAALYRTDPAGFLMGWKDGAPVSSISVVRYGSTHGFLGFYIVHPDWRGCGVGITTWNAGMLHLKGRITGLDGVVEQQRNYARNGFVFAGRNIRFSGVPVQQEMPEPGIRVRSAVPRDLADILTYQSPFFPADRDDFIARWTVWSTAASRHTKLAFSNGRMIGFGTIRRCRSGCKIGPLFAENKVVASALFTALCKTEREQEISLDVPEGNSAAIEMAENFALAPVFQTARMWRGDLPDTPTGRTFGVATFELG